jgi:hypothetical protein
LKPEVQRNREEGSPSGRPNVPGSVVIGTGGGSLDGFIKTTKPGSSGSSSVLERSGLSNDFDETTTTTEESGFDPKDHQFGRPVLPTFSRENNFNSTSDVA